MLIGGSSMYLIDESILDIQKFFQSEPTVEEITSNIGNVSAVINDNSMWSDYEACHPFISGIVEGENESPLALMEKLKEIWKDDQELGQNEFIRLFVVSAYRQTMNTEGIGGRKEQVEIEIPSYIYNF